MLNAYVPAAITVLSFMTAIFIVAQIVKDNSIIDISPVIGLNAGIGSLGICLLENGRSQV